MAGGSRIVDGRSLAWLGYLPVPGLALVPILARPEDRLARYHGWQAGFLVLLLYLALTLAGLLARVSDAKAYQSGLGFLAGLALLAGLVQLAWGAWGASQGRYPRLRPAWDAVRFARRD